MRSDQSHHSCSRSKEHSGQAISWVRTHGCPYGLARGLRRWKQQTRGDVSGAMGGTRGANVGCRPPRLPGRGRGSPHRPPHPQVHERTPVGEQGTTHLEDVSVAAEAITPIVRRTCADPLASPHCPAGGLGWKGRHGLHSAPDGEQDSTPVHLSIHPGPSTCLSTYPPISLHPVCVQVAPLLGLALPPKTSEHLTWVTLTHHSRRGSREALDPQERPELRAGGASQAKGVGRGGESGSGDGVWAGVWPS